MTEPFHIVCPHCHTTNRVRADQLGSAPDCGQCKKPLFTGKPLDLDVAAFDKHLQRNQIPFPQHPTLALFVGGREVARQAGAMGSSDIVRWVQQQLPR